jgi:ankyrin repeat protein
VKILDHTSIYPEALELADDEGNLPLHCLLSNESSFMDDASMMIEKHPRAFQLRTNDGQLALHVECKNKCRSAIISKCIELYPQVLDKADAVEDLPLNFLLWNELSSMNDALKMIEKYPASVRHRDLYEELSLHVECMNQCRSSIVAECTELYPVSVDQKAIS